MPRFNTTKTTKVTFTVLSVCMAALLATACGSDKDAASTTTPATSTAPAATAAATATPAPAVDKVLKDSMGHDVKVPANPKAVIASYLEDPLLALGIKPIVQWSVKESSVQDYLQTQLAGVPPISSTLPVESILKATPDFMIVGSESAVEKGLYEQYSKVVPTFVLGSEVIADYRKTLLKMGEILNKTDAANAALKKYDQKVTDTKAKLAPIIGDKKVAILWVTNKNFYVVNGKVASGAVAYGDLGLKLPNILAVLPEAKANWVPISLEKLAQLDADYIFLVNSDKGQAGNLEDPLWKNVPAVKSGKVFEIDKTSSWLYNGVIAGERVMDDIVKLIK
ncbi:ABC transporter substrate-binding protein [Paenibacillus sp. Soil750]|uniref:ABC transporter substrate-binding protein n=1 Tax=Paenibacillus sp. Soil750 TaxID=1736398 RepID=UPI001F48A0BF|nr:ABC transporter substrate-binding protein [Paenibacillus sp. Soil750]